MNNDEVSELERQIKIKDKYLGYIVCLAINDADNLKQLIENIKTLAIKAYINDDKSVAFITSGVKKNILGEKIKDD